MDIQVFLDQKYRQYNTLDFIETDPIAIPHLFTKKQDIEIAGFFAATLAWGQRKTILNKCKELLRLMDNDPYTFILHHQESDLKRFLTFKHRTFNDIDTLYFIEFFSWFYRRHHSLEEAFTIGYTKDEAIMETLLTNFHRLFFSLENAPSRTRKHVATPARKAACKRINMFLRWMVRKDDSAVDFGIWNTIQPYQLICPCDVHVDRVGRKLGLIQRKQTDWLTALELTERLRTFDVNDPVKYDFALFGLGVEEKF
ncbi:TIGR02757 family protein [Mongoliitalea daihaiensis]|uniref:TIGR02757 family protein n=1 Tax=Mongoliitalea daihaiensis TaxID=2782006 RepID=UPI001F28054A|nr:TIGR02757 family protein [Mongoliitalea daihaiensis]UJP64760.1 TIGR02757 family protein [Mongoliitalea daihaiensis]